MICQLEVVPQVIVIIYSISLLKGTLEPIHDRKIAIITS